MKPTFSAVLLAGGKSTRMGHDKAFLEVEGIPLWRRQFRLLKTLAPEQIFLAGPRRAEWASAGCEIIADAQPDAGPLAGLVAALRLCKTPLLLALAVDLPRMTANYLRALLEHSQTDRGVVPMTDRFEPLVAVYPIAALALAEEQLACGSYSLQKFAGLCVEYDLICTRPIPRTEAGFFLNLNTPADLLAVIAAR